MKRILSVLIAAAVWFVGLFVGAIVAAEPTEDPAHTQLTNELADQLNELDAEIQRGQAELDTAKQINDLLEDLTQIELENEHLVAEHRAIIGNQVDEVHSEISALTVELESLLHEKEQINAN